MTTAGFHPAFTSCSPGYREWFTLVSIVEL